jgi:hypothetical protein
MLRTIAPLVYHDRVDAAHIRIGTGSWQVWLSQNTSFRYESFWGSFTACKEHRGAEAIWIAYRHIKEQVRQAELGTNQDLTVEKLVDTAKRLSASDMAPWEGRVKTNNTCKVYRPELESNPKSQQIEAQLVHQWCVFYNHLDGQREFLGACWEKEHALNRIQQLKDSAQHSESTNDVYRGIAERYEIKEELVTPLDFIQKRYETHRLGIKAKTKEKDLLNQIAKLRQQIAELQNKLEQEQRLNANHASVKFIWN